MTKCSKQQKGWNASILHLETTISGFEDTASAGKWGHYSRAQGTCCNSFEILRNLDLSTLSKTTYFTFEKESKYISFTKTGFPTASSQIFLMQADTQKLRTQHLIITSKGFKSESVLRMLLHTSLLTLTLTSTSNDADTMPNHTCHDHLVKFCQLSKSFE